MNKNYYDILEVNKNASPEIIEKAYKTLVKKYHPDLQENNLKNIYEEKIKKINEAYDILSNPEKRKNYDSNLKNTEISISDYNILYQENINLKNNLNILEQKLNNLNNIQNNYQKNNYNNYFNSENNKINNEYNYQKNNIENNNFDYKNLFNFNKKFKDFLALIITIFIFLFAFFILWHIPFTKNYLINLYNNNSAFNFIINLFLNFLNN